MTLTTFQWIVRVAGLLALSLVSEGSPEKAQYVGSKVCFGCHPAIYRSFVKTDMGRSMRLANEIEHRSAATPAPVCDGRKEMAWIEQNRAAYMGLWVALDGDRLVAAGPDGKKVYEAAKAQEVEIPFISHIVPEEPHTSGWVEIA